MDDFSGFGDYSGLGQPGLVDGYPTIGTAGGLPQSDQMGIGNPFPGLGGGTPGTFNVGDMSGAAGGGLGGLLSKLGGLGGSPGQVAPSNAMASPASQPQGGGGMRNIQIPSPFQPAPPPIMPSTGQAAPYMGPAAPLGPGGQNPLLMQLLQQRLGMGG